MMDVVLNPLLNDLITGATIALLLAFFALVGWITYRVLRHGERYYGDSGEPLGGTPAPDPAPTPTPTPPRSPNRPRSRRRR
jgi:hypothetical protein